MAQCMRFYCTDSFRAVSVVEGVASEHPGCKFPNSPRSSLEGLYTETMGNLDPKA